MKKISPRFDLRFPFALLLALAVSLGNGRAGGHPDTSGWKELFAPDLSNAVVQSNSWTMDQGILLAKDHESLWTKKYHGMFVLDLEFKVSEEANRGGVLWFAGTSRQGGRAGLVSRFEIKSLG